LIDFISSSICSSGTGPLSFSESGLVIPAPFLICL
jgi:hypothetical protein